jgi:hypothetical protein
MYSGEQRLEITTAEGQALGSQLELTQVEVQ